MAQKRAVSNKVVDTDAFLTMPQSTQLLYFHFVTRADDDGFLENPKSVMALCRANEDDLKILVAKSYIIPFESGIIVIRHWRIHALVRCDRYKPTEHQQEKSELLISDDNTYQRVGQQAIPIEQTSAPELSEGDEGEKISIYKEFLFVYNNYPCSINKNKKKCLNLYYSWLNGKTITIMGSRKTVRYNHIQIRFALIKFKERHEDDEEQYIPRLPTFFGENTLCDFVSASREEYEEYMEQEYGDDWRSVKFQYDKGGVI